VNGNLSIPDDNVDGSMIEFNFEPYAEFVSEMGLLGIDYTTRVKVVYETSSGVLTTKTIQVPNLGDHSYQVLPINLSNANQVKVMSNDEFWRCNLHFLLLSDTQSESCSE
jgi:hypothetical protein